MGFRADILVSGPPSSLSLSPSPQAYLSTQLTLMISPSCTTTVTYSFAFFLPIILNDTLGFSLAASQCLNAPPYVMAVLLMYGTAWFGDKYRVRAAVIVFNCCIAMVGLPILGFANNGAVRYFGVFLATAGANANVPATMAYQVGFRSCPVDPLL